MFLSVLLDMKDSRQINVIIPVHKKEDDENLDGDENLEVDDNSDSSGNKKGQRNDKTFD